MQVPKALVTTKTQYIRVHAQHIFTLFMNFEDPQYLRNEILITGLVPYLSGTPEGSLLVMTSELPDSINYRPSFVCPSAIVIG